MHTLSAIILAAGKGTRMRSDLPKVAHPVADRPMVRWVADACAEAGCSRVVLVVGHRQEVVRAIFESWSNDDCAIEFAVQDPQLGTGHAVRCAEHLFDRSAPGDVFVLAGDGPLIRPDTLITLHTRHSAARAAASLATSTIDDPTGYGRIIRDEKGHFRAILEHKNCTPEQQTIREVNPSYYCFRTKELFDALERVRRDERTGEYFLTDVPALLLADGHSVEVIDAVPSEDVLSINTIEQLTEVDSLLRERLAGHRKMGGLH